MNKIKIEKIDQHLKGKDIDAVLKADLEKKKEILSKNKIVNK
ncbi:hypothetical protein [Chryseobacterium indologenes]|nr:hypothetical protein [Chryseobacterium indologenes]